MTNQVGDFLSCTKNCKMIQFLKTLFCSIASSNKQKVLTLSGHVHLMKPYKKCVNLANKYLFAINLGIFVFFFVVLYSKNKPTFGRFCVRARVIFYVCVFFLLLSKRCQFSFLPSENFPTELFRRPKGRKARPPRGQSRPAPYLRTLILLPTVVAVTLASSRQQAALGHVA